mmetsp:Transcript_50785/g.115494  ORF Transcript_50785/g.115494 Transcript_50785/m.115494 type:complete len:386 (-) Transcript_50785:802-1959(-)
MPSALRASLLPAGTNFTALPAVRWRGRAALSAVGCASAGSAVVVVVGFCLSLIITRLGHTPRFVLAALRRGASRQGTPWHRDLTVFNGSFHFLPANVITNLSMHIIKPGDIVELPGDVNEFLVGIRRCLIRRLRRLPRGARVDNLGSKPDTQQMLPNSLPRVRVVNKCHNNLVTLITITRDCDLVVTTLAFRVPQTRRTDRRPRRQRSQTRIPDRDSLGRQHSVLVHPPTVAAITAIQPASLGSLQNLHLVTTLPRELVVTARLQVALQSSLLGFRVAGSKQNCADILELGSKGSDCRFQTLLCALVATGLNLRNLSQRRLPQALKRPQNLPMVPRVLGSTRCVALQQIVRQPPCFWAPPTQGPPVVVALHHFDLLARLRGKHVL